jgi:hypothetical protein
MPARHPYEKRIQLCTRAYEAGIKMPEYQKWWPELGPLTADERTLTRAAVKRVIEHYKMVEA